MPTPETADHFSQDPVGVYPSSMPGATAFIVGSRGSLEALSAAITRALVDGDGGVGHFHAPGFDGTVRTICVAVATQVGPSRLEYTDVSFRTSGSGPEDLESVQAYFVKRAKAPQC